MLADEVGPRRPTGEAERLAATRIRDRLAEAGVAAEIEPFAGYSTFAQPFGAILGLSLAPALLPRARGRLRALLAAAAAAGLVTEGGLRWMPLGAALSNSFSQNLTATIQPRGEAIRTICLMAHLDTSRSGLMFHPRLLRWLVPWINAQGAAVLVQAGEPLLRRFGLGRRLLAAARALLAVGLALLIEREVRGSDVPGANDNASGTAVCLELARELAAEPLADTRVIVLLTGCEESGLLGSHAFLRSRDTSGWLFLNFDNVGAGTLHYVKREGVAQKWDADPRLIPIAERIRTARPDLGLEPSDGPIGLTYDVTPVLARGGRGLTLVAGTDGVIPNYHWPTDITANVDPNALGRAIETGREMIAAVDRGEAG